MVNNRSSSFLNLYLNDLPNCLNVGSPRMYADDTNVTFSAATIPDLESQIKSDLKYIDEIAGSS